MVRRWSDNSRATGPARARLAMSSRARAFPSRPVAVDCDDAGSHSECEARCPKACLQIAPKTPGRGVGSKCRVTAPLDSRACEAICPSYAGCKRILRASKACRKAYVNKRLTHFGRGDSSGPDVARWLQKLNFGSGGSSCTTIALPQRVTRVSNGGQCGY